MGVAAQQASSLALSPLRTSDFAPAAVPTLALPRSQGQPLSQAALPFLKPTALLRPVTPALPRLAVVGLAPIASLPQPARLAPPPRVPLTSARRTPRARIAPRTPLVTFQAPLAAPISPYRESRALLVRFQPYLPIHPHIVVDPCVLNPFRCGEGGVCETVGTSNFTCRCAVGYEMVGTSCQGNPLFYIILTYFRQ